MGMLIAGRWSEQDRFIEAGTFVRQASRYRDDLDVETVRAIAAEPGRFHLIASLSCPWSHRTTIVRALKRLEAAVPLQIAGGERLQGYPVNGGRSWHVPGTDRSITHLHELYALADPDYTGRATVPLLWDSQTRQVASNESSTILRAFDAAQASNGDLDFTLRPAFLSGEIESLNARLQHELSDAVYRAGLAQQQNAYDEAVTQVFAMLDNLETCLADRRYLFGNMITESDWRLFATLVRFDAVYHTHFRCTCRRLVDHSSLWAYARDLYAWHGVAATVDFDAIREGYYRNDGVHNPFRIVGAAPEADWRAPHGREVLGAAQVALRDGILREIVPERLA